MHLIEGRHHQRRIEAPHDLHPVETLQTDNRCSQHGAMEPTRRWKAEGNCIALFHDFHQPPSAGLQRGEFHADAKIEIDVWPMSRGSGKPRNPNIK